MRASAFAAILLATTAAVPAAATVLVADTGWQADSLPAPNEQTDNSPWTFTVTALSVLSLTDCCIPGDTFTLSGDFNASTTFFAGSPSDIQATGDYGSYWTDVTFSKLSLNVGPGSYSFTIVGDGVAGTPADLGVRLDTLRTVPEPASWALMIGGFGVVGLSMRSRRRTVTTVTFG